MQKINILATVGPNSLNKYTIQKMDESGVDMFRLNLSHTSVEDYKKHMNNLLSWTKKPVSTDTEGAQLRTGKFAGDVYLKANQIIDLTFRKTIGNNTLIPLYPNLKESLLKKGDILNIDFNAATVQIIEVKGTEMKGRVLFGGTVGNNKGIGTDRIIELPFLSEKDIEILTISRSLGLTHYALSFASSGKHVKLFRDFFPYPVFIISKIENRAGINNLKDICEESDEILIDRGDLSREISLNKIALAQKYILSKAKEYNTPVNIATNLLDTMMHAEQPSRAEINDITSSLLDGASGLVLAAETAIGSKPIKSVRFIASITKEVMACKENLTEQIFSETQNSALIQPHGGKLIQNYALLHDDEAIFWPRLEVDKNIIQDCIQICQGTFSPLTGFMGLEELNNVLDNYKTLSGFAWTMPVLLQISEAEANKIQGHEYVLLTNENETYAKIKVNNISHLANKDEIAQKWFLTNEISHPGVARFLFKGDYIVDGEVFLIKTPTWEENNFGLTPSQTRDFFQKNLWNKIVGFHTRNMIHNGHEFIQKQAVENIGADALFISPVIGEKKKGDFSSQAILTSYQTMLANNFYDPIPVVLGTFNTYSRYCGPREAIFTAICRKNFGCSHFIIGRDHTGVKDYYKNIDIEKFAEKVGNLGIELLFFDTVVFCEETNQLQFKDTMEPNATYKEISGTSIRNYILNKNNVPDYLARKEVIESMLEITSEQLFIQ